MCCCLRRCTEMTGRESDTYFLLDWALTVAIETQAAPPPSATCVNVTDLYMCRLTGLQVWCGGHINKLLNLKAIHTDYISDFNRAIHSNITLFYHHISFLVVEASTITIVFFLNHISRYQIKYRRKKMVYNTRPPYQFGNKEDIWEFKC